MSAKIIFLYAALAGLASAAQNASSITTNCVTSYGTKAQCHLTTSHTSETKTIPIEVKVTVEPSTSVTASPITTTTTVYSTTTAVVSLEQSTDTFSSTSTYFVTETASETETATEVTTTTTTTITTVLGGTSTIEAAAGFTPIQSAINAAGGSASKLRRHQNRQAPELAQEDESAVPRAVDGLLHGKHAAGVVCNTIYEVESTTTVTVTGTTQTATSTLPGTTDTVTSTSVITSTSTATPTDAATTETFSTTSTVVSTTTAYTTTTSTATASLTQTVSQAQATAYGGCAANNLGRYYAAGEGFVAGSQYQEIFSTDSAASAYDCCVSCLTSTSQSCGASVYVGSLCLLIGNGGGTCVGSAVNGIGYYKAGSSPVYTFMNAYCGQWTFASQ